jgi:hypothetical protein
MAEHIVTFKLGSYHFSKSINQEKMQPYTN